MATVQQPFRDPQWTTRVFVFDGHPPTTGDYRTVASIDVPRRKEDEITLGPSKPRCCYWCPENDSKATFRKEAHVAPQGLGSPFLLTNEECDGCNAKFGQALDDPFVKFFSPLRALMQAPFRGKAIRHVSHGRTGSNLFRIKGSSVVGLELKNWDQSLQWDEEGRGKLSVKTQPLSLISVAKNMARMSLLVLDSVHRQDLTMVRDWVLGLREYGSSLTLIYFPSTGPTETALEVRLLGNQIVGHPVVITLFYYANLVVAWHGPSSAGGPPMALPLPSFPAVSFEPDAPTRTFNASRYRVYGPKLIRTFPVVDDQVVPIEYELGVRQPFEVVPDDVRPTD